MTDKEYEAEKKRVKKYVEKWQRTLGLGAHKIDITWERGTRREDDDVAIHCNNSWQYRLVAWNVYLPVTHSNDDRELEHIVVHELSHSLIAPLAQRTEGVEDIHEFSTECVAQAILWAYEAGAKKK